MTFGCKLAAGAVLNQLSSAHTVFEAWQRVDHECNQMEGACISAPLGVRAPNCIRSHPQRGPVDLKPSLASSRRLRLVFLASLSAMIAGAAPAAQPTAAPSAPAGRWQEATLASYEAHLKALTTVTQACATARDLKTCDPLLVGPDDRVPLAAGANAPKRLVRYGWLRVLLSRAEEPDAPAPKITAGKNGDQPFTVPPPPTSQLLRLAQTRLAQDLAQVQALAAPPAAHSAERATMQEVLSGREYRNLQQADPTDTLLEKLGNWLNRIFDSATRWRAQSAWIGRLVVYGFLLGICVALVWRLLQLERRWRVRLVPEDRAPAAGAASTRNWQLWLDDARKAAAAGQWREAIHFVYWAAISRLESRRLWPADRARTPREYLALVAPEDSRRAGLATLTGSFERTWYGGRAAVEGDYKNAEALATALIDGVGAADAAVASAAKGGAR